MTLPELQAAYAALPPVPKDLGTVSRLVLREPGEKRICPPKIALTRAEGAVGDKWKLHPDPEAQITVMRADVAQMLCPDGAYERLGDNLFVLLDLSEQHLPAGPRIRVGTALCEVTAEPHTGCSKFRARAGKEALQLTVVPENRPSRLRGIHLRVLEDGEVALGDTLLVQRH